MRKVAQDRIQKVARVLKSVNLKIRGFEVKNTIQTRTETNLFKGVMSQPGRFEERIW